MSTDHIDLTELSKVRENLEFFEKKLQENRERKLQKKLELEKAQAETVSTPNVDSQPETTPSEQPTDVQPETVPDVGSVDVTPDANSTPETVPVEAATEKEADTTVFAFNSMVEPSRGLPGSWGKVIHHDAANDEVYVEWQDGKLKDRDGFGAYSVSDLKVRASIKKKAELLAVYTIWKSVTSFNEDTQDWSGDHQDMGDVAKGNIEVNSIEDALKKAQEDVYVTHPFEAVPDEPGRYETNQVEDVEGLPDENGKYLADYSIYIKMYKEADKNKFNKKKADKCEECSKESGNYKLCKKCRDENFQKMMDKGHPAKPKESSKKKAALVRDPDYELRKGTKFILERSIMTKSGVVLESGTKGEITDIIGDHIHFISNGNNFVLNKFDALKLNKTSSRKIARKTQGKRKKKADEVEETDVRDNPEFQQAMSQLAQKTGLEYDGGSDSRLFLQDEQISTYAPALGEEGYAKMEDEMAAYSDRGAGFEVYVWNDSSGFDYWNKEDEMNYIQVTVDISPEALMNNEINPEEVVDKAYTAHAVFEKYEGTGDYTENLRRREQSMESELTHSDTCDTCGTKQRYPGQCNMCRKNKELGTYRKKQTMQLSDFDKKAYDVEELPGEEDKWEDDIEELSEPTGPTEDDIIIQDEGHLGSEYGAYHEGKQIAKAVEWDDLERQIKEYMSGSNYYPGVFYMDDHGGVQPISLSANKVFKQIKYDLTSIQLSQFYKTKKALHTEVTPPQEGDPQEKDTGYGGDRGGVWVAPKRDKDVSLEGDKLEVANRKWEAVPSWDISDEGNKIIDYKVYDDTGRHIMTINPKGQQLNKAQLENIIFNELGKHDLVQASADGRMMMISDLVKDAKVVKRNDGYHVVSENGKNLGGPYPSKEKAESRLKQVEYFKQKKSDLKEADTMKFPKRKKKPTPKYKTRPPTKEEKERVEKQYKELEKKEEKKSQEDVNLEKEAQPEPKPTTPPAPGFKWVLMEDGKWVEMESGNTPGVY